MFCFFILGVEVDVWERFDVIEWVLYRRMAFMQVTYQNLTVRKDCKGVLRHSVYEVVERKMNGYRNQSILAGLEAF